MNRNSLRNKAHAFSAVFERRIGVLRLADIGQQRDGRAILERTGLAAQVLGLSSRGLSCLGRFDFLVARVDGDLALRGADNDSRAIGQIAGPGCGNHGDDAAGTSQNRGMAGRPTLSGDDGQRVVHIQRSRVGRRQILGDQHEWMVALRHAWGGNAKQIGDHALPDIVQITCALGHVATERGERLLKACEALEHGAISGFTLLDELADGVQQCRVPRHLRQSFEYCRCLPGSLVAMRRGLGTGVQIRIDRVQRSLDALDFALRVQARATRDVLRFLQR
jgi:hypothetical protein